MKSRIILLRKLNSSDRGWHVPTAERSKPQQHAKWCNRTPTTTVYQTPSCHPALPSITLRSERTAKYLILTLKKCLYYTSVCCDAQAKWESYELWDLSDSPVVFNLYLGLVRRDEGHARLDCATWFHSEGQTFGKDYSRWTRNLELRHGLDERRDVRKQTDHNSVCTIIITSSNFNIKFPVKCKVYKTQNRWHTFGWIVYKTTFESSRYIRRLELN